MAARRQPIMDGGRDMRTGFEPWQQDAQIQERFVAFGKYKRLLLVASLPLLLLGFDLSAFIMPFARYVDIRCSQFGDLELCVNSLRNPRNFNSNRESTTRFEVSGPAVEHRNVRYLVEADERTVGRVTVQSIVLHHGLRNPRAAETAVQKLIGRTAMLHLGVSKDERSVDFGGAISLFCNTLEYDKEPLSWFPNPGPYNAVCVGDDWSGYVSFAPNPEAQRSLALLRNAVGDEVGKIEREFWVHRIGLTVAPLVLFLIVSAIVWLTRKAAAYVRAG